MKKKDIIQLVKEAIKETTFYGNRHQRSSISGLPGVMEDENLKEFTDYGQEGRYPKKEKPGDMFQQKEVEDLFPNGMASRSDKAFQARVKQHADWTEQRAFNTTFVHMQYHETKGLEDDYFIYQTQHYNGNYTGSKNPRFTEIRVKELDDETKEVFKTFKEINQLELVRQAGIRQQYIDQSVSLNLAFPAEATPKWINKIHLEAWKKGIKTLYYMRTQSVLRGDIAAKAMDEECLSCDG